MNALFRLTAAVMIMFSGLASSSVRANPVEDFYKGKQINLIVGFGPGGGYDVYARLLAQYMSKFIPGKPPIIIHNMPGAGSLVAANYLYNVAAKDGTVMGTFGRDMILAALLELGQGLQFDPKKFEWLGSMSSSADDAYLLYVRRESSVHSVADLEGPSSKLLKVGGTAGGAGADDLPALMREVLDFNLQIVSGYPDNNALFLAFERGEIDGMTDALSVLRVNRPNWLQSGGLIRPLVQFGRSTRHPDFPDVPTARELAKDDKTLRVIEMAELPFLMSRPFTAPPGIPEDRAKALRDAFDATLKDDTFLLDAKRLGVDIGGTSGEEIRTLVGKMSQEPEETRDWLKRVLSASAN